jgi:hypothetical protein
MHSCTPRTISDGQDISRQMSEMSGPSRTFTPDKAPPSLEGVVLSGLGGFCPCRKRDTPARASLRGSR